MRARVLTNRQKNDVIAARKEALLKDKRTINGEQLATAINYLIWWEGQRIGINLHPDKKRDLVRHLKDHAFVQCDRALNPLRKQHLPNDAWSHVIGAREADFDGPYVTSARILSACTDRGEATFFVDEIAMTLEPELWRHTRVHWLTPGKERYFALVAYLNLFASGEVTERDLLAA